MAKLPRVSGHKGIRALEKLGFRKVRQGSHVVVRKPLPSGDLGTVIPLHRELAAGTLRGMLKQAGINLEEFLAALH